MQSDNLFDYTDRSESLYQSARLIITISGNHPLKNVVPTISENFVD
jgi:hypothetical protein